MDDNQIKAYWDNVFGGEAAAPPQSGDTGNDVMNRGLDWLCEGAESLLDFGCGNGNMLFRCAFRGTAKHTGIDLSSGGIARAEAVSRSMPCGSYRFVEGGIDALDEIPASSVDGVILSNIVDNVDMDNAVRILEHAHRIARAGARLFIKLNPYLTEQQIAEWNIRIIKDDLLDDGLLLLNMPTERWLALFDRYFKLYHCEDVYFKQYDQTNRVFLMTNRPD